MPTPTDSAPARVRAALETTRLFFGGTGWWLAPLIFAWLAWPFFILKHDLVFVLYAATLIAPGLAITAAILGRKIADRLAFAASLPRASSPKWLLLSPLLAAALLMIAAAAIATRRSPLVALTAIGCCWWAIAVGPWIGRRWWTLLAVAALAVPPAAILPLLRHQRWGLAAAVSIGFAALGLLLSPERRAAGASSTSGDRFSASRAGAIGAASLGRARTGEVASALRLWSLGVPHVPKWMLLGGLFGFAMALVPWSFLFGIDAGLIAVALVLSSAMMRGQQNGRYEFLCTLPAGRRIVAGPVLLWTLPALIIPLVLLARLQLESVDGNGTLAALVREADPHEIRMLRETVFAPLPATWSRGGFPADHWPALVAATRTRIVCTGLVSLAFLFSLNASGWLSDVKTRITQRWAIYLLTLLIVFGARQAVATRVPSVGLLALLVADTALIWFLASRLPPRPAAARRGPL
jgi:hypothetical protein